MCVVGQREASPPFSKVETVVDSFPTSTSSPSPKDLTLSGQLPFSPALVTSLVAFPSLVFPDTWESDSRALSGGKASNFEPLSCLPPVSLSLVPMSATIPASAKTYG